MSLKNRLLIGVMAFSTLTLAGCSHFHDHGNAHKDHHKVVSGEQAKPKGIDLSFFVC
ncbi:hypothetical protein [Amphritea opalescens]|uniref:hypothetical protein n=1 Tax=Amphritea opalescens TaxID=2490544 RepID=UPI0013E05294|nr:hypothetical protein [Amphritea opalescens]